MTHIAQIIPDLADRLRRFDHQRKKVKALKNYADTTNQFQHSHYLILIRRCLEQGFLDKKEADFIEHLLSRYDLQWLDWAYKTPWLKREMRRLRRLERAEAESQMYFDFTKERQRPQIHIPLAMLAKKTAFPIARAS